MIFKPHPYQQIAIDRIIEQPRCGLFLQMGLGKTVSTLTAVSTLLRSGDVEKVLVIAPLSVARTVWAEECRKWDHLHHLTCVKVLGSAAERAEALQKSVDMYIINRDNVPWLVDHCKAVFHRWPFDMVIIDELSSFKSASSQRFKKLRLAIPHTPRVVGLTGTPAPNGYMDLWSQIYLLDGGERLGRTIGDYRRRYFTAGASYGRVVYDWRLNRGADQQINERLKDLCVSMTAEDWLTMPERIMVERTVELPPAAVKAYKTFAADMVVELTKDSNGTLTAASAAVLAGRLLQMASGSVYLEDGDIHDIHDAKLDALKEIIDTATSPVLVFYGYRHELHRLIEAIPQAHGLIATPEQIAAWNRGEIPVLLAHPASAGHGLNLQAGGHTVVWYSLPWSLELYQQANARLWRQGQPHAVIVHHLIAADTIDRRVMQVLASKDATQSAIMDAVKAEAVTDD